MIIDRNLAHGRIILRQARFPGDPKSTFLVKPGDKKQPRIPAEIVPEKIVCVLVVLLLF